MIGVGFVDGDMDSVAVDKDMGLVAVERDIGWTMYSLAVAPEAFVGHLDNSDCTLVGRNCHGQAVQLDFA